jgi:hypothetical protein
MDDSATLSGFSGGVRKNSKKDQGFGTHHWGLHPSPLPAGAPSFLSEFDQTLIDAAIREGAKK